MRILKRENEKDDRHKVVQNRSDFERKWEKGNGKRRDEPTRRHCAATNFDEIGYKGTTG
jgi:hypothetical protein